VPLEGSGSEFVRQIYTESHAELREVLVIIRTGASYFIAGQFDSLPIDRISVLYYSFIYT